MAAAERGDDGAVKEVLAFFRSSADPSGSRFVKVSDRAEEPPTMGLSAGWLAATVLERASEDFDHGRRDGADEESYVHVRFSGYFWDARVGYQDGLGARVHSSLVALRSQSPTLLLSLFCLRSRDYWSNRLHSDWDVTSDGVVPQLLDGPCGVHEALPGEYELHTAWVANSADLRSIDGEAVRRRLRAPNIATLYFVWPRKLSEAEMPPGCVDEFELFALAQRLERAGIPSAWPAPVHLHRQLSGKFWAPQMCLNPDFKLPATTRVHYAEFAEDKELAAQRAIGALLELRNSLRPEAPDAEAGEMLGVVKMGYSWRGEEVLPFCGPASLVETLEYLMSLPGSKQTVCTVQEMVPDVACELRLLCFHDAADPSGEGFVKERVWIRMGQKGEVHPRHRGFQSRVPEFAMALEDDGVVGEETALDEFFGGSQQAKERVQELAETLSEQWLLWFSCECPEPPAVVRLDFLVEHSAKEGGYTEVWTSEVVECGASMCGIQADIRNAAVLNAMMRNEIETDRFPKKLPAIARGLLSIS